jgi:3-dehydroshikimate dehydratase
MFTLSAFADEISADPGEQLAALAACNIHCIEFRSIYKTNVLNLTDQQIKDFQKQLKDAGVRVSAIGSPIGKIKIDEPFEPHLQKLQRALELCEIFGTKNIRIFSYYPPDGFDGNWQPYRNSVIERIQHKADIAAKAGVELLHENEHRIYGDSPERVADLFANVKSPAFKAVHDPANFVYGGYDPWAGWLANKPHLAHFHVKDWQNGQEHGCLAGQGSGQMQRILGEMVQMKYTGFTTLEPHLLGGGPTGGVTGPELFPQAVAALRQLLDAVGAPHS